VTEIVIEQGFIEQKVQAEVGFSFLGNDPRAPNAKEKGEYSHFGQRIVAPHHLTASRKPKLPLK
jgi:hypothetical protein